MLFYQSQVMCKRNNVVFLNIFQQSGKEFSNFLKSRKNSIFCKLFQIFEFLIKLFLSFFGFSSHYPSFLCVIKCKSSSKVFLPGTCRSVIPTWSEGQKAQLVLTFVDVATYFSQEKARSISFIYVSIEKFLLVQ